MNAFVIGKFFELVGDAIDDLGGDHAAALARRIAKFVEECEAHEKESNARWTVADLRERVDELERRARIAAEAEAPAPEEGEGPT